MQTADGIAIVELQDRRLGCLAMMFWNFLFVANVTPFWLPRPPGCSRYGPTNFFRSLYTYMCVLFVLWWDGLASCLRTREYKEFTKLVREAGYGLEEASHWHFKDHPAVLHTLPCGYVKMFTGEWCYAFFYTVSQMLRVIVGAAYECVELGKIADVVQGSVLPLD